MTTVRTEGSEHPSSAGARGPGPSRPAGVDAAGLEGRRAPLAAGTVLGVLGSVVTLAQPLLAGRLIADVSAGTFGLASVLPLMALFAVDALLAVASQLLLARASEGYVYGLRSYLISRVLRGYWPSVHGYDRGDLYSRLVVDTALAKGWIVGALPALLSSLTLVVGCGVAMALLNLPLFLLTFAVLVVFGGVAWWTARGVQRAAKENQEDTAGFIEGVQRMVSSLVTIKAAGLEQQVDADATDRADRARRSGVRVLTRTAVLTPVMNVGTQAAIAVAVIAGAAFVASGTLTAAAMVSFFMYLLYIVAPLVQASSAFGEIAQCRAALARVREVGALPQERVEAEQGAAVRTSALRADVEPPRPRGAARGRPGAAADGRLGSVHVAGARRARRTERGGQEHDPLVHLRPPATERRTRPGRRTGRGRLARGGPPPAGRAGAAGRRPDDGEHPRQHADRHGRPQRRPSTGDARPGRPGRARRPAPRRAGLAPRRGRRRAVRGTAAAPRRRACPPRRPGGPAPRRVHLERRPGRRGEAARDRPRPGR
ncbi:ABC transporter ATP-binding protein [Clavibacter tessellarius]